MKKVELRAIEETKYKIIKNLVDNNGNKFKEAEILNLSIRQINRLILKLAENLHLLMEIEIENL